MSEKTILTAGKLIPLSIQTGFDEYCFIRLCNSPSQDARRRERMRAEIKDQRTKRYIRGL